MQCVLYTCVVCRLCALKEPVYSQKEAEMAAGMGSYVIKSPEVSLKEDESSETMT